MRVIVEFCIFSLSMHCLLAFPHIFKKAETKKDNEQQLVDDLLKALEEKSKKGKSSIPDVGGQLDLNCDSILSSASTLFDFADTSHIRCVSGSLLRRLGRRMAEMRGLDLEVPEGASQELENFMTVSACVMQTVGPAVAAEIQSRLQQGGDNYQLPADCPSFLSGPTEDQCDIITTTASQVDRALGTYFSEMIDLKDKDVLKLGRAVINILLIKIRDSSFTLPTNINVPLESIDCVLNFVRSEFTSKEHLLGGPSGPHSGRDSKPSNEGSHSKPDGGNSLLNGGNSLLNGGNLHPGGGNNFKPNSRLPKPKKSFLKRSLVLDLVGVKNYNVRDIPDAHKTETTDDVAEQCTQLLDIIEYYSGMDFAYVEHLSCISNEYFSHLGNVMSGVESEEFDSALEEIYKTGNEDVAGFFSFIGCTLYQAAPRLIEIAVDRSNSGGKLPESCPQQLPDVTHEQCLTILEHLDADQEDFIASFGAITQYNDPTLLKATLSFVYIQLLRLQDPTFIIPGQLGVSSTELTCFFYGFAEHLELELVKAEQENLGNDSNQGLDSNDSGKIGKSSDEKSEKGKENPHKPLDKPNQLGKPEGQPEKKPDGKPENKPDSKPGDTSENKSEDKSENKSEDSSESENEWCSLALDAVKEESGIDFASVSHLDCVTFDEFNEVLSNLIHIDGDKFEEALEHLGGHNEDAAMMFGFVGCTLLEMSSEIEEIAERKHINPEVIPENCPTAKEPPSHEECMVHIESLATNGHDIIHSFEPLSNVEDPELLKAAMAFFRVQIYRIKNSNFVMPPQADLTLEQLYCVLYGMEEFLAIKLLNAEIQEQQTEWLDDFSPDSFAYVKKGFIKSNVKRFDEADDKEIDVENTNDNNAAVDCSSLIDNFARVSKFDYSTFENIRCFPMDKLTQLYNLEQASAIFENFRDDMDTTVRTFMETTKCVMESILPVVVSEFQDRISQLPFNVPSDCPALRPLIRSTICHSSTTTIPDLDLLLGTNFGGVLESRNIKAIKLSSTLLNLINYHSRQPSFSLPSSSSLSLEDFDCVLNKIKRELRANQMTGGGGHDGGSSSPHSKDNSFNSHNLFDNHNPFNSHKNPFNSHKNPFNSHKNPFNNHDSASNNPFGGNNGRRHDYGNFKKGFKGVKKHLNKKDFKKIMKISKQ